MSKRFEEGGPVRRMSARESARLLNRLHADATAQEIVAEALAIHDPGDVALVSSFGAEAAVLLHMVAETDPSVPVLLLETGMLFPETLDYQRELTAFLGLRDVRLLRPEPGEVESEDPEGRQHRQDPDGCCDLRKTRPLRRALAPFAAWITGRKRFQSGSRAALEAFEHEEGTTRLKINPLARWSAADVRAYLDRHNLPRHPLVARGYPSIGCAPCTSRVADGEDPRAGRWRGRAKEECGIHFDGERWVRTAASLPG